MKELPRGYFAVQSDFENSDHSVFSFRGETFAVKSGENLFATLPEALKAALDATAPDEVICSLPYEGFNAPVILFSAGSHVIDRVRIERSVIMLGENAGVNPNLAGSDRLEMPTLNPERTQNESVLSGSYWFGKIDVIAAACETIIMDGFTSAGVRFKDARTVGGKTVFESRNIIHEGPCGWEHNQYNFVAPKADGGLDREVKIINNRVTDFPDHDYAGTFVLLNAHKALLENICFTGTGQLFGLTSLTRGKSNCSAFPETDITIKDCYLAQLCGEQGISIGCFDADERALNLTVSGCTFIDACREGEPVIKPHLANDNSTFTASDCVFKDSRKNISAAIAILGHRGTERIENCTVDGFADTCVRVDLPPENAPDYIDSSARITDCEDPHEIIENADFTALDAHYEGRKAYYGDQHVHTKCGGTSDGSYPMADWPAEMDRLGIDFAAVVDHRQMRGFFLPEWDEERFIIGTEPSARLMELNAAHEGYDHIHYNMLFPHKYGLAMVLANFPEFDFHGDELNGSFKYPAFTKERFMELTKFIQSIGGIMVHPHPKQMLASDDPLDFYVGEHMHLETLYCTFDDHISFKNYELWKQLLALGKHVYTSGGSDTHRPPTNALVSTFYTKEKSGKAFFDQMHSGDYTVGCVGMKMFIDGNPMGSELEYKDNTVLTLRVGDFFDRQWQDKTAYELRLYSDKGLVYKSMFNGKKPQQLALKVQKRAFYRAEVFDLTHGYRVAVGNPIWLDK